MIDHVEASGKAGLRLLRLDRDGTHVAIVATTRRLRVVPTGGGKEKGIAIPDPIAHAVSPDGAALVIAGEDETALYAFPSLEKRWALKEGAREAAFSRDGLLLALTLKSGAIRLVHARDGRTRAVETEDGGLTRPGTTLPSPALAFDPGGELLFCASRRRVEAIDLSTYSVRAGVDLPGACHVLARSDVTPTLVTGGDTYPEGVDPTIGAHPEVEHLTAVDAGTLRIVATLPLDPSRPSPDAYGKTGTVRRASFVPGTDTFLALHERTDGRRFVHGWAARTGARILGEEVDRDTRDLAADRHGHVWLLTLARAWRWKTLDAT